MLAITAALAQTAAPTAANNSSGAKLGHHLAPDGTRYVSDVSDYLPDLSQTDTISSGQVGAFYRGAVLSFMLLVLVGMLIRSRQQARNLRQLQVQEKNIRSDAEEHQREFLRRQHLHFENTPLVVVELDAQLHVIEWAGRAEAVFGWRAMEVLGKAAEELDWVDQGGAAALRMAFGPATGAEKSGVVLRLCAISSVAAALG